MSFFLALQTIWCRPVAKAIRIFLPKDQQTEALKTKAPGFRGCSSTCLWFYIHQFHMPGFSAAIWVQTMRCKEQTTSLQCWQRQSAKQAMLAGWLASLCGPSKWPFSICIWSKLIRPGDKTMTTKTLPCTEIKSVHSVECRKSHSESFNHVSAVRESGKNSSVAGHLQGYMENVALFSTEQETKRQRKSIHYAAKHWISCCP